MANAKQFARSAPLKKAFAPCRISAFFLTAVISWAVVLIFSYSCRGMSGRGLNFTEGKENFL
jgi:hypothetical protein